jgi:hypothetical protein
MNDMLRKKRALEEEEIVPVRAEERLSPLLSEFAEECVSLEDDDELNMVSSVTNDGRTFEIQYSSKDRRVRIAQEESTSFEKTAVDVKLADLKDGCYEDILDSEGTDAMLQSLSQDYARDPSLFIQAQGHDFDWAKLKVKERSQNKSIRQAELDSVNSKIAEADRFTLAQWMSSEGIAILNEEEEKNKEEASRCLDTIRSFSEYQLIKSSSKKIREVSKNELTTRINRLLASESTEVSELVRRELAKEDL